jgi:predicted ATPase/DNA-binding winged helix-turn-helix (wHTH) protein
MVLSGDNTTAVDTKGYGAHIVSFGAFQFDMLRRSLTRHGRALHLRSREAEILHCLVEQAGQIVSKSDLMKRVWPNTTVSEGNLRVQIASLRRLFGESAEDDRFIIGIPNRGYSFRGSIAADFGATEVPPVPETQATRSRHDIPLRLKPMIGRTELLERLTGHLLHRRLVTIVGAGGLGKTTLALRVAERLLGSYRDGVRLVELAGLSDPRLVVGAIASSVQVPLTTDKPADELIRFLANKNILLLLDNCEHLVGAVAQLVEDVLKLAPNVHFVTTSREPLRIDEEWLFRLGPLELPPHGGQLTTAEILAYSSVQLFVERALQSDATLTLSEDDTRKVAEICRRLDGNPLAIELAAARVDIFGIQAVAERLDRNFALLTHGRRTAEARHQTLRATLDWSYELLTPVERTVLNRLSVFRGEFALRAACEVICGDDLDEATIIDALAELVAKSLVVVNVTHHPRARYRLLFLTRDYAREKLQSSGEGKQLDRQHAIACLRILREPHVTDRDFAELGWIDDVRAAVAWGFSDDGDLQTGMDLTTASVEMGLRLSLFNEYARRIDQALARTNELQPRQLPLEIRLLVERIHILHHTTCDHAEMKALTEKVQERAALLSNSGPDEQALMEVHGLMFGFEYFGTGNWPGALKHVDMIKALATKVAMVPGGAANIERMAAEALYFMGDNVGALRQIEKVLAYSNDLIRSLQTVHAARMNPGISARIVKARILWAQGRPEAASDIVRQALDSASYAQGYLLCHVLAYAAIPVAYWRGDLVAVRDYISLLLSQAREHSLNYWAGWGLAFEHIFSLHGEEVGGSDQVDALPLLAVQMDELATLHSSLAGAYALSRIESGKVGWCAAEVIRAHAARQLSIKQITEEAAEALLLRSLAIAREQSALSWELRTATDLARLWSGQGRRSDARNLLSGVYGRLTEGMHDSDAVKAKALIDSL